MIKLFIRDHFPRFFKLLKLLKKTDYRFLTGLPKITESDYMSPIRSNEEGNKLIYNLLTGEQPCMISRLGSAELTVLLNTQFIREGKMNEWNMDRIREGLFRMNAVFPAEFATLERFSDVYFSAMPSIDALAVWYNYGEQLMHQKYFSSASLFPIESLEPFRFNEPWSRALKNKKVLVVLPFELSVKNQFANRSQLFSDKDVLPDFELTIYRPFNSYTDIPDEGKNWFDYLEKMKQDISLIDFEIALIAAGPFGLPLAAAVKASGRKAVHVGGALQLLFGIKGNRWEERPEFAAFMNEHWVKPSANEIPATEIKEKIDNSSYW